jgi:hypothetical protein
MVPESAVAKPGVASSTPSPPPVAVTTAAAAAAPISVAEPAAPKRVPKPKAVPLPAAGGNEPVAVAVPLPASPPMPVEAPPPVPATERQAPAPLPGVSFLKVRLVTEQGGKAREVDVNLMFLQDGLGVSPAGGGAAIRSVRYQDVTRATYEREDRRRLFGKSAKHLLTIETAGDPLVLRLDKGNFDAVIGAFEERAKKTVQR